MMKNIKDLVKIRRSVRAYDGRAIPADFKLPKEKINRIEIII